MFWAWEIIPVKKKPRETKTAALLVCILVGEEVEVIMSKHIKQYLTWVSALGKNKGKGGSRVLGGQRGILVKMYYFSKGLKEVSKPCICRLGKGTFQIPGNSKFKGPEVAGYLSDGQQGSQCGHSGVRKDGRDAINEERHG